MKLMKSEKHEYKKRIYRRIYIRLKKKLIFIFLQILCQAKRFFNQSLSSLIVSFKFKLTKLLKLSKILIIRNNIYLQHTETLFFWQ